MAEVSIDAPSKACTRCREVKAATSEFFSPKRAAADGLQVWCKACCAEQKREYRRRCPDSVRASRARYEATHSEAIKAQQRASHLKHREQRLAAMRAYWQRVGPERKEAERRMRATSPAYREVRLDELRRWKAKDPERFRRLRAEWWQRRTPAQKLRTRLSNAIRDSLKGRRKGRPWQDLLGYTVADLKLHLERQFLNGMTWENHGALWHVDHIVPVAAFRIEGTDCPEFRACWAITNLRPLWAEDNLMKKAQRTLLL